MQIVAIDIVLGGDNAVVIGLAAAGLAPDLRRKAILIGILGATVLRKKLKDAGVTGVTVTNKAIANLDGSADLVITQQQLTARAKKQEPQAIHVSVENFLDSPAYDEVAATVAESQKAKK